MSSFFVRQVSQLAVVKEVKQPLQVAVRCLALRHTCIDRRMKEAKFPTSIPFTAAPDRASEKVDSSEEDIFEQTHYKASTEEPIRSQRTAAESQLWSPIVNKRIGRENLSDAGGRISGGRFSASASGTASASPFPRYGSASSSTQSGTATAQRTPSSSSSYVAPLRLSTMHRPFMGTSTRFRNPNLGGNLSITRTDIINLEKEYLSHSPPGRINDHLCIVLTRLLRWVADRAFRERYIHRATMLTTVGMAAPAAGAVAAYIRMMLAPKRRLDAAPFVHPEVANDFGCHGFESSTDASDANTASNIAAGGAAVAASSSCSSAPASSLPSATGRKKEQYNSYADELRGLFSQSECHAVHYQILLNMAEIKPLERALVLCLQAFQFAVFFLMFLFYPRMGFRLMGYMAEESSVVWTQMVNDIDLGKISEYHVPDLALSYWGLQASFTAQEALVPAVIPPKPSMAAALAPEESEEARQSPPPFSSQGPYYSDDLQQLQQQQQQQPMRIALPKYNKLRTRSQSEAAAATAAQSRGSSLDGDRLTLRDIVLLIRSDEMIYRDLNHRTANSLDRGPHEPGVIVSYLLKRQRQK